MASQSFNGGTGLHFDIYGNTKVFYTLTSQSAGVQSMTITDPSGNVVAQTSVKSRDMSNTSSGTFRVGSGGKYKVTFASDHTVYYDATDISSGRTTVASTYLFAGEDGNDNDNNDMYATISWFYNVG